MNDTERLLAYLRDNLGVTYKNVPSKYRSAIQKLGGFRAATAKAGLDAESKNSGYWNDRLSDFREYVDAMTKRNVFVTREIALNEGFSGVVKHYGGIDALKIAADRADAVYDGTNGNAAIRKAANEQAKEIQKNLPRPGHICGFTGSKRRRAR